MPDFDPRVSPHSYGSSASATEEIVGVIIVDHGSKRDAANKQLTDVVEAVKARTGRKIVEAAHMEICSPSLKDAYATCVQQGAQRIVCHPYFLSPGRHVTEDIPVLLAEAASAFPDIPYVLTLPLGASEAIPTLIAETIEDTLRFYPGTQEGDGGFLMEILRMTQEQIDDSEMDLEKQNGSGTPPPPTIEELAGAA